ncbi:class I SAM-dependent methyltransferase [Agromyces aureus]|uniref:SAM-dependent methyltransferase n=1 Tax=Agromyces aureus TaxID=453304 RepID=A0A191WGV6_9MICO|nr:methyltransferase domain-containing protein [Agromyces aureus]ANJ27457.1 SAM-dependent methyltransferase [Agromyces aureus]
MPKSDAAFEGSIPVLYEQYLSPLFFEPYAVDIAQRIAPFAPRRLLETAAGTGVVTRELERVLGEDTAITATDLNQAMIDVATTAPESGHATWTQCDAMALPFAEDSFDLIACQFGVMFFPERTRAYQQAARVLARDGTFIFTVWDSLAVNDVTRIIAGALTARYPDDPPSFIERVPFGYFDVDLIRSELIASGFAEVDAETVTLPSRADTARDAAIGVCQGTPVRAEIEAREAGGLQAATEDAAQALITNFGSGRLESTMQAITIAARL